MSLATAIPHQDCRPADGLSPEPIWRKSGPKAVRLAVLYPETSCHLELTCGKDMPLSGQWGLETWIDGSPALPISDWSESCSVSDEDVHYLELEIELNEGVRVQRHVLLARKDRFLFLADAVLGTRRAALEYRGTLPLGRGVTFRPACETREGMLVGRKPRAMVLPLALPEWRADQQCTPHIPSAGSVHDACGLHFNESDNLLELRQAAEGRSLFAPLLLDLDRRRIGEPLTWRQLTVAESQVVRPADAAVGYRVAIGRRQWLIYRSLLPAQNRTLLGHNLSSEMLVARFTRKGEVKPLIEIEEAQ